MTLEELFDNLFEAKNIFMMIVKKKSGYSLYLYRRENLNQKES